MAKKTQLPIELKVRATYFYADWCSHCDKDKQLDEIQSVVSSLHKVGWTIQSRDVDLLEPDEQTELGIVSTPCVLFEYGELKKVIEWNVESTDVNLKDFLVEAKLI